MHGRPGQKLRAGPSFCRQYARCHHRIQRVVQQLERIEALGRGGGSGCGTRHRSWGVDAKRHGRKRGAKPAGLLLRKLQIGPPHGRQQATRPRCSVAQGLCALHVVFYALRQLGQGSAAHRLKQGISIGKMAVGGIGRHAHAPGGFAQHNGGRTSILRQIQPSLHQGPSQVAVVVGIAFSHAQTRLRAWRNRADIATPDRKKQSITKYNAAMVDKRLALPHNM